MKYYFSFFLFFLGSFFLHAQETCNLDYEKFQSGFYAGLRAGVSEFRTHNEINGQLIFDDSPAVYNTTIHKKISNGGLHFGYLYRYNQCPFILAPEIFITYNPSSSNASIINEPFDFNVKTRFSLGANLRAGALLLDNLLLYGLIGVTGTSFVFESRDNTVNQKMGNDVKFASALTYGAGIEHEFITNNRIRLEFTYSDYKKINFAVVSNDRQAFYLNTIKPKIYTISLMYSIKF